MPVQDCEAPEMNTFESLGVQIACDDCGDGDPILPIGFAADRRSRWRLTDRKKLLSNAGFHVIPPGAHGHGRSDKPTCPEQNTPTRIAGARDLAARNPIPVAGSIPGAKAAIFPGRSRRSCITDSFFSCGAGIAGPALSLRLDFGASGYIGGHLVGAPVPGLRGQR
jgi:hypothetical protein